MLNFKHPFLFSIFLGVKELWSGFTLYTLYTSL